MEKATLVAFIVISLSANSQLVPSSCEAPPDVMHLYMADAERLALRWTIAEDLPYADSVAIDPVLSSKMEASLIAVHNAYVLDARDSVTLCYNIHTLNSPVTNCVFVSISGDEPWMQQVKDGIFPTDNEEFNQVVNQFALEYGQYYEWPWGDGFLLNTLYNYNLPALAALIATSVDGVTNAEPGSLGGDGDDVMANVYQDYVEITYRKSWDDCQSGCQRSHYWKFQVYNETCTVMYAGSWGDPVMVACASFTEASPVCQSSIYPNPSEGIVNFTSCYTNPTVEVYDLTGRCIFSQRISVNKVDLSFIPGGSYLVALRDENNARQVLPFVKN